MRIVLINPPMIIPKKEWDGGARVYPPIGLAYVAAILEEKHDVKIIDAVLENWRKAAPLDKNCFIIGLSFDEIAKKVIDFKADVVGITGMSFGSRSIYKTAEAIKNLNPKIKIIVGGPHASIKSEECIKNKAIDFLVRGEGEITAKELIDAIEKNKDVRELKKIKGIAFKYKNKIVFTEPRPFIENLDSVPFPARHLLKMEEYFKIFRKGYSAEGTGRWVSIVTSRGCPFNCCFCSAFMVNGKKWRYRSPENIVREIEDVVKKYKVNEIYFEDENMSLNKERMEKLCDLIIKKNFKLRLCAPQGFRADTIDEKTLRKMKKAGFWKITVAPESGVQRVVDEVIEKRLNLKKVEETIKTCKKIGIAVSCFFVIGIPGETKEDIKKTLIFARKLRKLGAFYCTFNNALPIIGTRMYYEAKEKGYLLKDGKDLEDSIVLNRHKHLMKTPEWKPEEIEAFYRQAIRENARDALKSFYLWNYRIKMFLIGFFGAPKLTIRTILKRTKELLSGKKVD